MAETQSHPNLRSNNPRATNPSLPRTVADVDRPVQYVPAVASSKRGGQSMCESFGVSLPNRKRKTGVRAVQPMCVSMIRRADGHRRGTGWLAAGKSGHRVCSGGHRVLIFFFKKKEAVAICLCCSIAEL
jgi:hypothetical protein